MFALFLVLLLWFRAHVLSRVAMFQPHGKMQMRRRKTRSRWRPGVPQIVARAGLDNIHSPHVQVALLSAFKENFQPS